MKLYLLLALAPLVMALASCEKKEYVVPNRTILVNLNSGSWISSGGGKTYTAAISMPEIDSYFNESGAVLVYASFGNGVYEQVPEVFDGVAYSFTHKVGQVAIDIQSADGKTVLTPPGALKVKIVLVESGP